MFQTPTFMWGLELLLLLEEFIPLENVTSQQEIPDTLTQWLDAGLVQEWVKTGRLLLLVQHSNAAHGLLVCHRGDDSAPNPILPAEHCFPIDGDFKCEIDTSCAHSQSERTSRPTKPSNDAAGSDIYVKVVHRRRRLLLEMPATDAARAFLAHVSKAAERTITQWACPAAESPESFLWLQHYGGLQQSQEGTPLQSPGEPPRQSIAEGATPLAARESVVRLQLAMREDDYTHLQELRLLVGTWNVNGQAAGNTGLSEWLSCDAEAPQLYAVGFQELDLSKEALLFADSPREEEWLTCVAMGLHPGCRYKLVKLVRLVGMMLVLFVDEALADQVHEVEAHWVGTGILGKMGNKGAVAVRLRLHASTLCFVNCHLAAHLEECQRRNQDFADICARLAFGNTSRGLGDHDQVFWLGDLNYRLADLDPEHVKTQVEQGRLDALLAYDQLRSQQRLGRAFMGYEEGPILFRPTYKYTPGSQQWDLSEKQRAPAWCDRVLWRGPHVTQVQFERLRFMESQVQTLTVANTGQVPVEFCFRAKHDTGRYCKDWLRAIPSSGAIKPGETCLVTLELCVDKRTAWQLNSASDSLEDILVLHLERGKDIFISF
ncbi:hypothetical protein HPB47_021288 [Ixodes persulcatus]|uniref:Uncharacterized protein n=1 Tax=Ixodes persulcatus TaxID=34615 RepID=A0AC60QD37_IXOPE|nr:hypothetical protein HPB47_021288 [Ixodes persulcatus]